jgi:acetate kinase
MLGMSAFSILVFNARGAELRFALFEAGVADALKPIVHGRVRDIGEHAVFEWRNNQLQTRIPVVINNQKDAVDWVLEWLEHLWPLGSLLDGLKVVAHYCVNCMSQHASAMLVDEKKLSAGCPVHKKADEQCGITASQHRFGRRVKVVVVFNHNNASPEGDDEARIAELALDAVQAA